MNNLTNIEAAVAKGQLWVAMNNNRYWRVRRNGATKVWKTRPGEFRIPLKAGLKVYGEINHNSDVGTGILGRPDFLICAGDPNSKEFRASMRSWESNNLALSLELTINDAESCSGSGRQDDNVLELSRAPYVVAQTDCWDRSKLADELSELGVYDATELADHDANIQRMLWIAACEISEREPTYNLTNGTVVNIRAHHSDPGAGLSYDAMERATLLEDCNGTGWDVVDVLDSNGKEHSVYSFDVSRAE